MMNVTTNQMTSRIVVSLTLYRQYSCFCRSVSSPPVAARRAPGVAVVVAIA